MSKLAMHNDQIAKVAFGHAARGAGFRTQL